MRSRDTFLVLGFLSLLAATAVLLLTGTEHPVEAGTRPEPAPPGNAAPEVAPLPGPAVAGDLGPAAPAAARATVDTAGWTSGMILGDIQLAASVMVRLQSISVVIEENRTPWQGADGAMVQPFRRIVPLKLGIGTPTFEIRDVPFSEYGYVVRSWSPGLNGSQQTVTITREQPLQEVLLAVTPGAPCSILLRDQDRLAVVDTEVFLLPQGEPPGRPSYRGTSDNFGVAVFDDVLAGDYRIFVGHVERPLADPVELTMQPGAGVLRDGTIQAQGLTVLVPRGLPLTVSVRDGVGYGIAEATVKLLATDRTVHSPLEAVTDYAGNASFPYLAPGNYQIDVFKTDFERRSRTITIKQDTPPEAQVFQMARIR